MSEHEWISVGESVPTSGKEYWVWWLGFPPTWAEFRARYEDIPAHWLFDGGGAEPFDGGRVTHYMPYYTPEPPEEAE